MALHFYDRDGKSISLERFTELQDDNDYRIVCTTDLDDEARTTISTIWLGFAHTTVPTLGHRGPGPPPFLFETAVFGGRHAGLHLRSATEEQARRAHQHAIDAIVAGQTPFEGLEALG